MTLSLEQAAGQVLIVGFTGTEVPARIIDDIAADRLAGVILFKRNIESSGQVAMLCRACASANAPKNPPLLICVDQEGGRVARLGEPVLQLPPMRELGRLDDVESTRRQARILGTQLRALGFTLDFAPVLDVDTNPQNPIIGDRAFGDHPEVVIRHGLAFAEGLLDAGLLCCAKHFPGHGDTREDSHVALPRLTHTRDRLDRVELAPFVAAIGKIPALMTAHVIFDAIDPEVPATLSSTVISGLLKGELGYDGVVVTDDLEMSAVKDGWGVVDAGVRAIAAGCDLLLVCSDLDACHALREALTAEAERDAGFRARLLDAHGRVRQLRDKLPAE